MKLDGNLWWPHKYFRSKGTRWWEWIIPTWKACLHGVVFDLFQMVVMMMMMMMMLLMAMMMMMMMRMMMMMMMMMMMVTMMAMNPKMERINKYDISNKTNSVNMKIFYTYQDRKSSSNHHSNNLVGEGPLRWIASSKGGVRLAGLYDTVVLALRRCRRLMLCDSQMQDTPRMRGRRAKKNGHEAVPSTKTRSCRPSKNGSGGGSGRQGAGAGAATGAGAFSSRECRTRGTRSTRPWCGALWGGDVSVAAVWHHCCSARGPMITGTPLFKTQWHLSRSYSSPETQRVRAARTVHPLHVGSCKLHQLISAL